MRFGIFIASPQGYAVSTPIYFIDFRPDGPWSIPKGSGGGTPGWWQRGDNRDGHTHFPTQLQHDQLR